MTTSHNASDMTTMPPPRGVVYMCQREFKKKVVTDYLELERILVARPAIYFARFTHPELPEIVNFGCTTTSYELSQFSFPYDGWVIKKFPIANSMTPHQMRKLSWFMFADQIEETMDNLFKNFENTSATTLSDIL